MLMIAAACTPGSTPTGDGHGKGDFTFSTINSENPAQWEQIIVHLDVAGVNKYRERAAIIKDQEAAKRLDRQMAQKIAVVADQVLKRVEPAGATLIHRYHTLPLLALQASPAAVAILKSMPEVQRIEISNPTPPSR